MPAVLLASILISTAADQAPDRNLDIAREAQRYAVPGRSFRAFERNLEAAERHGRYSFLDYGLAATTMIGGYDHSCRHEAPSVELDIRFTLPRWTQYPAARDRDRQRFEAFEQSQVDYLSAFDALLVEAGGRFLADLRALPPFDCDGDEGDEAFDLLVDAWNEAIEDVYDAYRLGETVPEASDQVCAVVGDLIARCAPPAETAP